MRIVFMGTPDFAIPSLKTLVQSHHNVVAVVTVPDKPAGRGKQLRPSAVKRFAVDRGLPLLQPENLRDEAFIKSLVAFQADLFVVVAFRILPVNVFTIPPRGTVNLHASLLPAYRGAAPINWAIINGEKETGITTFFIEEKVDTGEILLQRRVPIPEDMTAGELHDILSQEGAKLLLETADGIEQERLRPIPQVGEATKAPKITKELRKIDWSRDAQTLHNLVRGLSPVPGSYTYFRQKILKVLKSHVKAPDAVTGSIPGTVVSAGKNGPLEVQTGKGVLQLLSVQPADKRPMSASEFIRGYRIQPGEHFGNGEK